MKTKLISICLLALLLTGCPIDGDKGKSGLSGINCWDLNGNRIDDPDEDINSDGAWDVKDCSHNQGLTQNQDATLNHQHLCEAFANLNEYPEGCPSNTHTVPSGTLTDLDTTDFYDDGNDGYESCATNPSNGLLSIKYDADKDSSFFVLEGGYIADKTIMFLDDVILNDTCIDACSGDANCIASLARKTTSEAFECYVFYHSDSVAAYEQLCGVSGIPDTTPSDLCLLSLSNLRWASKCP